jgi:hypothetical protein
MWRSPARRRTVAARRGWCGGGGPTGARPGPGPAQPVFAPTPPRAKRASTALSRTTPLCPPGPPSKAHFYWSARPAGARHRVRQAPQGGATARGEPASDPSMPPLHTAVRRTAQRDRRLGKSTPSHGAPQGARLSRFTELPANLVAREVFAGPLPRPIATVRRAHG